MVSRLILPRLERFKMETFYINLKRDDEIVSKVTVCIQDGVAEIHQDVYKFTLGIYRDFLLAFEDLKEKLKEHYNVHRLITATTQLNMNSKMKKYWKLLGFFEVEKLNISGLDLVYSQMEI